MITRFASLLATAILLVVAGGASAAGVEYVIPLGGAGEGRVEAGRPFTFGVLIPGKATKVQFKFKLEKGSGLDFDLEVTPPGGEALDYQALAVRGASLKIKSTAAVVKNLPVTATGLYQVTIRGKNDTAGGFVVSTKGKGEKKVRESGTLQSFDEVDEIRVSVVDNTYLSAKLKPGRGSVLEPTMEIYTASGNYIDLTGYVKLKKSTMTVKNLPLPFFGDYLLRVKRRTGVGAYDLSVKLKAKKVSGKPTLPVADAGENRVGAPGATVILTGTGTPGAAYLWEQVSGPPVVLSGPNTDTPSLTAPSEKATLAYQLVTSMNGSYSAGSTTVVEVDRAPISSAGRSRIVAGGAEVGLDGGESFDLDPGDPLFFDWRQVSGPAVTLSDPRSATPSFTAPAASGTLVFELVVGDGVAESIPDRVSVNVDGTEAVADAGRPVVVTVGDTVRLSGLGSRSADGTAPASWLWRGVDVASSALGLLGSNRPVASFSAPRSPGTFRYELIVDGNADTADVVTVLVLRGFPNGEPKTAAGGITTVGHGGAFTLSPAGSTDPDGDALRYEWLQTGGADSGLTDAGAGAWEGTAPATDDVLSFLLMAHDGRKYGSPDLARVISGSPDEPVADAGVDGSGAPGNVITLSSAGSLAAPGDTIVEREWVQTSGLDLYDIREAAGFDPAAEEPRLTVPETIFSLAPDRSISLDLFVTDDRGARSLADIVTVTFRDLPLNAMPAVTATASAALVRPGAKIQLVGTASDRNGDPLDLQWRRTNGFVAITDSTKLRAEFTVPEGAASNTLYEIEFSADDGTGTANAVARATVTIRVNLEPSILATVDPAFAPDGAEVTLDGSASSDPDGDQLEYLWEEIDPPGAAAFLPTAAVSKSFIVPAYSGSRESRTRTFRLTVTDPLGSKSAEVKFIPNRPPVMGALSVDRTRIRYDGTDAATFTGGGTDPDGDPLEYTWRIVTGPASSGATLSAGTGTAKLTVVRPSSSNADTGGVWTVGAKVTDGLETGGTEEQASIVASPSFSKDLYSLMSGVGGCTTSSCHSSSSSSQNGSLKMSSPSEAYGNLVNVKSVRSSKLRVKPDDVTNSYLHEMVNTGQMPKLAPKLPQWQINIYRDWIDPDHQGGATGLATGAADN